MFLNGLSVAEKAAFVSLAFRASKANGVVADEERAMYVSAKTFQNRYISLLWNVRSFRGII